MKAAVEGETEIMKSNDDLLMVVDSIIPLNEPFRAVGRRCVRIS
jgi:hypothetical protein